MSRETFDVDQPAFRSLEGLLKFKYNQTDREWRFINCRLVGNNQVTLDEIASFLRMSYLTQPGNENLDRASPTFAMETFRNDALCLIVNLQKDLAHFFQGDRNPQGYMLTVGGEGAGQYVFWEKAPEKIRQFLEEEQAKAVKP